MNQMKMSSFFNKLNLKAKTKKHKITTWTNSMISMISIHKQILVKAQEYFRAVFTEEV